MTKTSDRFLQGFCIGAIFYAFFGFWGAVLALVASVIWDHMKEVP